MIRFIMALYFSLTSCNPSINFLTLFMTLPNLYIMIPVKKCLFGLRKWGRAAQQPISEEIRRERCSSCAWSEVQALCEGLFLNFQGSIFIFLLFFQFNLILFPWYVQSTDPTDKDVWKDKGMGHLSIKCKEGVAKATKESKPTIIVRNEVCSFYTFLVLIYWYLFRELTYL
jgi:hypothetical protein